MDAQQIGRVLSNLLGNALRHTPPGGTVRVQARRMDAGVVVAIRDTGEGIDAQDLPHVFERFYRGEKSRNRATGALGWGWPSPRASWRPTAARSGVESAAGEGTRFLFTLPPA